MAAFELFIDVLKDWSSLYERGIFWNPIVWIIIALLAFLLVYVIRSFGKKKYKQKTDQTQSFLSGNPEYEKEQMRIKSSNVYWGFTESLKWIYNILRKIHTGNASDYVLWFVIVMGVLFIILEVI